MGVDATISLPPNVQVRYVAYVAGILLGLKPERAPLNSGHVRSDGQPSYGVRVPGVTLASCGSTVEMCDIVIGTPAPRSFFYHFESTGGRRSIRLQSTAENIALLCSLADFFGGVVDYEDCDEIEKDYVVPDKPDAENCADDGKPWDDMIDRVLAVKPLARKAIKKLQGRGAYDGRRGL